jgi:hypothetical protein
MLRLKKLMANVKPDYCAFFFAPLPPFGLLSFFGFSFSPMICSTTERAIWDVSLRFLGMPHHRSRSAELKSDFKSN